MHEFFGGRLRWRRGGGRSLWYLSIDVGTEDQTKFTCCRSSLLLGVCYSSRFDIIVRVIIGIQHSLPFGRLPGAGLGGGYRSTL